MLQGLQHHHRHWPQSQRRSCGRGAQLQLPCWPNAARLRRDGCPAAAGAGAAAAGGRSIVLAVDKNAESEQAITWAASQLLRPGDSVHIFAFRDVAEHSQHAFDTPGGKHVVRCDNVLAGMQDAQDKQAGAQLARALAEKHGPRVAKAVGSKVGLQTHVLPSAKASMGQELCRQAEALDAAVVVVASHSRGGGLMELFGSPNMCDYCVRHCSRPVVVLHDDQVKKKAAKTATQGTNAPVAPAAQPQEQQRQLVVAVDSTPESVAACEWILEHLYRPGDVIHLLHVVPCLPLTMPLSPSDYLLLCTPQLDSDPWLQEQEQLLAQEEVKRWQEVQASMFREVMQKAGAQHTFDTIVRFSEDLATAISTAICSKAAELQAAAVILAMHEERADWLEALMPGITNQVSHRCACPVVVLHGSSGSTAATASGAAAAAGAAAAPAGAGSAEPVAA